MTIRLEGSTFTDGDGLPEMVVIAAGTFAMGAPPEEGGRGGRYVMTKSEGPVHHVTIPRPLAVGRFPVTRAQYARFATETRRPDPPGTWTLVEKTRPGDKRRRWAREMVAENNWHHPGYPVSPGDDHPAACLSWYDARDYIAWLAETTGEPYRMLSEAEWEYAARAGTTTARFWGDGVDQIGQFANVADLTFAEYCGFPPAGDATMNGGPGIGVAACRTGHPFSSPVGSFAPNAFGLHDMLGNVVEYCEDVWHDTYDGAPADGSAWLTGGDPARRISRGGHWALPPATIRCAWRGPGAVATENYGMMGIRVAKTLWLRHCG